MAKFILSAFYLDADKYLGKSGSVSGLCSLPLWTVCASPQNHSILLSKALLQAVKSSQTDVVLFSSIAGHESHVLLLKTLVHIC